MFEPSVADVLKMPELDDILQTGSRERKERENHLHAAGHASFCTVQGTIGCNKPDSKTENLCRIINWKKNKAKNACFIFCLLVYHALLNQLVGLVM